MNRELYNVLCENGLGCDQVIVALTSRDICSVIDFLERGEDALKDMRDKYIECNQSWSFPEYMDDDFRNCKLVTLIQRRKLERLLESLRDTKK
jgi:hypothetical protein